MRENRTSGSMRRGEKRVMVHSANGHRTRKGGNSGAPPDLYTTALALHSTLLRTGRLAPRRGRHRHRFGQNPKVICSRFAPIPSRNIPKGEERRSISKERVFARHSTQSSRDQRVTGTASRGLITQTSLVQIQHLI